MICKVPITILAWSTELVRLGRYTEAKALIEQFGGRFPEDITPCRKSALPAWPQRGFGDVRKAKNTKWVLTRLRSFPPAERRRVLDERIANICAKSPKS